MAAPAASRIAAKPAASIAPAPTAMRFSTELAAKAIAPVSAVAPAMTAVRPCFGVDMRQPPLELHDRGGCGGSVTSSARLRAPSSMVSPR